MKPLVPFSLPISGLRDGMHTFRFQIGEDFFRCFEGSTIEEGELALELTLDKRPNLMVLHFQFDGTIRTECDRCLETFDLPIQDTQDLMVKFDDEPREEVEVIYIERLSPSLNVAKYVYEFIHLAVPMHKTHDEAGGKCDPKMMAFIDHSEENTEETETDSSEDSVWSELKKWNDE